MKNKKKKMIKKDFFFAINLGFGCVLSLNLDIFLLPLDKNKNEHTQGTQKHFRFIYLLS